VPRLNSVHADNGGPKAACPYPRGPQPGGRAPWDGVERDRGARDPPKVLYLIGSTGFVRSTATRQFRAGKSRTIGVALLDVTNPCSPRRYEVRNSDGSGRGGRERTRRCGRSSCGRYRAMMNRTW
jgi:hypothetical protein